jgi:hypothetical protein
MSSSDLIQEDHRAMLSSAEPITGDAISIIWLCYLHYELVPLGLVFCSQLFTYLLIFIYLYTWFPCYTV